MLRFALCHTGVWAGKPEMDLQGCVEVLLKLARQGEGIWMTSRADVAIQIHVGLLKGHHASPSKWACCCVGLLEKGSWWHGTVAVEHREGTARAGWRWETSSQGTLLRVVRALWTQLVWMGWVQQSSNLKARGYNGVDKGQKAMICQRCGAAWMAHNLGEHLVSTECNRHAKSDWVNGNRWSQILWTTVARNNCVEH